MSRERDEKVSGQEETRRGEQRHPRNTFTTPSERVIDARLIAALEWQLERRRAELGAGATHVGWKLGVGDRERIGAGPVIGYLTSASLLRGSDSFRARAGAELHADAELALELGDGGAIVGYGAALEFVDLRGAADAPTIVAENVFHRAVCFGPMHPQPFRPINGRLLVNGRERARATASGDVLPLVDRVGELLEAVGERLTAGDRLITGSIVQVPVRPGDRVRADLGRLGFTEAPIVADR
jgi:2-keto-4-pentenoate hydratase